jgi:anti-anti-sigma regulatory factor
LDREVVDVRIDTVVVASETVVRISGRLCGAAVEELREVCRSLDTAFALDLSGLTWADAAGLAAIGGLIRSGRPTRGLSPFIELMLEDPAEEEQS